MTNYCADCEYCKVNTLYTDPRQQYEFAHCHRAPKPTSLVHPALIPIEYELCSIERSYQHGQHCGPTGRNFVWMDQRSEADKRMEANG